MFNLWSNHFEVSYFINNTVSVNHYNHFCISLLISILFGDSDKHGITISKTVLDKKSVNWGLDVKVARWSMSCYFHVLTNGNQFLVK